nr:receptor protein-tyrosine kinase CEPR1-like [Tanacetum cinerariifolium]
TYLINHPSKYLRQEEMFNLDYSSSSLLLWNSLLIIIITLVLVVVVVYYYYYSTGIKVNKKPTTSSSYETWTTSTAAAAIHDDDRHHTGRNETMLEEADAKYAQELQFQEALLASSVLASQASTSTGHNKARSSSLSSLLQNNNIQHQMCRICLEKREYWQMFTNTTCSHSFCYDCTRKHATTKIQEKISTITCPELNCKSTLDFNSLRLIVPKHILIKWDQVLCESSILESHKFYCPFADCSALLINDDSTITQNNCPVCKRSICAVCHVPWHSEFTCKKFGKLNTTNKKGKQDYEKLAMALAKKNKWKKCPNCKFYVEKTEGKPHHVLEQGNDETRVQQQMCGICLETQDYQKMFKNSTCSHSFCNDCTRKYATTKIQEKNNIITCPESNCNSTLDFNTLRLIIPKDILIKWDDVLCESLIPESDKFYCPFLSCSTLLIKDDKSITKTNCPLCKRSLCALCRVPWHSNFTCYEFEKRLNISKKADEMAIAFAKKKKWKRCPNCNFFVEKTSGCSHIICRSGIADQVEFFSNMKNSVSGTFLINWDDNGSKPVCNYTGISCDKQGYVVKVDMSGWVLSGRIPENICSFLPRLKSLNLGYNKFDGDFPHSITNCSLLEELNITHNNLTGKLPDLSPMQSLRLLDLSSNFFAGTFPISFINLTNLEIVNFNENGGFDLWKLPKNVSRLVKLKSMILSTCMVSGSIPKSIGNMTSLVDLELSGNFLVGPVPRELGLLKNLQQLELYYNQLVGGIPDELGNLTQLTDLDMSVNMLTGSLPESVCRLPKLQVLQLYNNSLSGEIPHVLENSTTLTMLSLYSNYLTGEVPRHLGRSSPLTLIDLSENRLTGELPHEVCNGGGIPESLGDLLPSSMNFSNNLLSGPIPLSFIKGGQLESFAGNKGLCISVYQNMGDHNFSSCSQTYNRKKFNCFWVIGASVGLVFIVGVLFIRHWFSRERDVVKHEETWACSYFYNVKRFHQVSFNQHEVIEAMVEKNVVGHGGSGMVYKVVLSNGQVIAVKRFWSQKLKDGSSDDNLMMDKELKSEVETLGCIRHKNIVKLYCYLSSCNCNLLVYEYMPNGSLWDALHHGKCLLDWPTRYQIALGIAKGLAYLHHDLLPSIIHRDVKSTNILLDGNFHPKVADFGLAKVLNGRGKDSTTTVIAGTYGYLAPEYAYSSKATTKCDVYSFGVVLMELITGKKPVEAEFGENKNIIYWISTKVDTKEGATGILDKRLSGVFKDEMIKVLRVAILCTCRSATLRPTMNERGHNSVGRRTAETGNGFESRDPRDVEIERLQQRIQELELQQEDQWSSEQKWETQDEGNPFSYVCVSCIAAELIDGKTPYVVSGYELRYMSALDVPDKLRVKVIAMKLRQHALLWWDHVKKQRYLADESSEFKLLHPDQGESLVIQRILSVATSKSIDDDSWHRNNIFRTKCTSKVQRQLEQFFAARTPQQNGVVKRRNRTLVEAARTMLTFANLPSFLWAEDIATSCFTQNRSIIHKRFDKTPYELINKRKPNIKFFRVFGYRCYLLNDYEDVGNLKAKGDIGVFVGYSKESAAFRIYNKRTRKIHESVNVNFDEILAMASKQFSLEPGLSNLNETGKSSNPSVSQGSQTSKKDLEDLFYNFYDEYFDSSKIMKSSTTNVDTSINEEVFHEVSESFQGESSSSSLNDDVQQSPEEVIPPQKNTQSMSNNMIPNDNEASTSHNVFNERLEDAYFDASTSFHDPSNVHTFYQPYPHKKKWTKDHPLHKIIDDLKSSVCTRGQLANSCLLSSIEPANVAEALIDADWVSAMQEELDQFARLKV